MRQSDPTKESGSSLRLLGRGELVARWIYRWRWPDDPECAEMSEAYHKVAARLLAETGIDSLLDERDALRQALTAIAARAESWHGDDEAAKGSSLGVVSRMARAALERTP